MGEMPLPGQTDDAAAASQPPIADRLTASIGRLRDLEVKGRYRQTDRPLDRFLIPALQVAVRYDRVAGYFTAGSLARASAGLDPFRRRGGYIRMVVNAELGDDEVAAVTQGMALRDVLAAQLGKASFAEHDPTWPDRALGMLALLVALGQLDIKVAVPLHAETGRPLAADEARPLHHAKFGILVDADGDRLAFSGSNNETTSGWNDNYETFDVYPSWLADWQFHGAEIVEDFRQHWEDGGPPWWHTYELPDAARRNLIRATNPDLLREAAELRDDIADPEQLLRDWGLAHLARDLAREAPQHPEESLADLVTAPARITGVGLATSVAEAWPHQIAAARRLVGAWPCSRLLADQVGLGKTIEVALALRELLISGTIESALLLTPASVLTQWQDELWERATLWVPRLVRADGLLEWPDKTQTYTTEGWEHRPVLLASSHLARRRDRQPALTSGQWDLVVVDEAHHARRRGSDPRKDEPNLMLRLLRAMRGAGCWYGLWLATATPMQMHPHEAWDLLELCGLPEKWRDPQQFAAYYHELDKPASQRDWTMLRDMHRAWSDFDGTPDPVVEDHLDGLATRHQYLVRDFARHPYPDQVGDQAVVYPEVGEALDLWLREHTPLRTLTLRATRHLLRAYEANGMLPADIVIPQRHLEDVRVELTDEERALYDRIERWIRRSYNAHMRQGQKALGFIMTVYRRRLTSSFAAIEASLQRRLDALDAGAESLLDTLSDDDQAALEDADVRHDELLTGDLAAPTEERDELAEFLDAIKRRPDIDTKFTRLYEELQELFAAEPDRTVVVFTEFTDTMDWLRVELARIYGSQAIACYSGRGQGGEIPPPGDPLAPHWKPVAKADILARLRQGDLRLLLGTDAMSEGLNLQTADVAVNFDLPWNFMRIEQRIGRIDRIRGHPHVHIRNLVVENTIEQQVYDTIAADHDEFVDLIGPAAPVLGGAEDVITNAALAADPSEADQLATQHAQKLVDQARNPDPAAQGITRDERLTNAPLPGSQPTDGERHHAYHPWHERIRRAAFGDPAHAERLTRTSTPSIYTYQDHTGREWPVTFDPATADAGGGDVGFFVWGHPAFPSPH